VSDFGQLFSAACTPGAHPKVKRIPMTPQSRRARMFPPELIKELFL
jgi:hypothetical protein